MRLALVLLLLAACGKPCPLVCQDDSDCPAGAYCFQHETCLASCTAAICGNACVDTFHNCTGCGIACLQGQVCTAHRTCDAACDNGFTSCSGSCSDLAHDRTNCGGCGHICNTSETCIAGVCHALASCG